MFNNQSQVNCSGVSHTVSSSSLLCLISDVVHSSALFFLSHFRKSIVAAEEVHCNCRAQFMRTCHNNVLIGLVNKINGMEIVTSLITIGFVSKYFIIFYYLEKKNSLPLFFNWGCKHFLGGCNACLCTPVEPGGARTLGFCVKIGGSAKDWVAVLIDSDFEL